MYFDEFPRAVCDLVEQCGFTDEVGEEDIARAIAESEEYMAFAAYKNPSECSEGCRGTSLLAKTLKDRKAKRK
jgi:hypothetical protein